ncbi:hypothetical protein ACOI1H_16410 [Loktanella sp. DJP18]|uniref:hypothetical protein n=1 Tax=Loktanella sp. DJP18 TaxID=3409788 RepID=UPI003BB7E3A2
MMDLAVRKTHTYVGTFSHLDDWDSIGSFDIVSNQAVLDDDQDPCEPTHIFLKVLVQADAGTTDADIESALRSSLSKSGCAHEHDCCGCVSTYVNDVMRQDAHHWAVIQHASRNF